MLSLHKCVLGKVWVSPVYFHSSNNIHPIKCKCNCSINTKARRSGSFQGNNRRPSNGGSKRTFLLPARWPLIVSLKWPATTCLGADVINDVMCLRSDLVRCLPNFHLPAFAIDCNHQSWSYQSIDKESNFKIRKFFTIWLSPRSFRKH